MELGEKIRTLRKEQNLSQEALAEKLQVSRQSVSKWESDQSLPEISKILLMCDLFGISTDEFLKKEQEFGEISRMKSSESNSFMRWIKRYQRELIIAFAFILTVSLILNFEGRSALQDYQRHNELVRNQLYVSYFEELDLYYDRLIKFPIDENPSDSSGLMVNSRRILEMANHHYMLDLKNEAKAISSIIYGSAVSLHWVTEKLEESRILTPNEIERIDEIPDLIDEILVLEKALREEIETHGYDIEKSEVYEEMYSLVIEMAMLTYAHGFAEDQIRL